MKRILKAARRTFDGALLDISTASQLLGCSERSLRARVARHTIPFRKLDSRVVFRRSELELFIADLPGVTLDEALANAERRNSKTVNRSPQ